MTTLSAKRIIKIAGVILAVMIVGTYALYEFRNIIEGPKISITSPTNGSTPRGTVVTIEGRTENISMLTMNDKEIFVDTEGQFKEVRAMSPGYNVVKLYARDRHDRETSESVEFFIKQSN